MTHITLWFANEAYPELCRWQFFHPCLKNEIVAIRGKGTVGDSGSSSFQWTSAVRALAIVFLKARLAQFFDDRSPVQISGTRGSFASSLDDALYKEPEWMCELFGLDGGGRGYARRIFSRVNPGQKRREPVSIGLNHSFLGPLAIDVFLDGNMVSTPAQLATLITKLGGDIHALIPTDVGESVQPSREDLLATFENKTMQFKEEWLAIINNIAQETETCLRGMVMDSKVANWWMTSGGIAYTLTNFSLVRKRKSVKRIFLLNSHDHSHRRHALLNAYVNQLAGIDVKVLDYDTFLHHQPVHSSFFSVHDTEFVAVHKITEEHGETRLLAGRSQVSELVAYYEELFNNGRYCQDPTTFLRDDATAPAIKAEALLQYAAIKKLSSQQSIIKILRNRKLPGLVTEDRGSSFNGEETFEASVLKH